MIDWLTVELTGPWGSMNLEIDKPTRWHQDNVRPGLFLHLTAKKYGIWDRLIYITDAAGEKYATISARPTDRKRRDHDEALVQFANPVLATGEWRELLQGLEASGGRYTGVNRIDLAVDGWEDEHAIGGGGDYIKVVQAAMAGFGNYYGRAHWRTHHLGKVWNGFEFGNRGGDKFMRCYRKKREMKSKGHKPHIEAAWRAALGGYDVMKDRREVARMEVKLMGRELRRYYTGESTADGLYKLHDPTTRVGIFASCVNTLYDFRTHPTDGRARSARTMHRWNWSQVCGEAVDIAPRAQRARIISPHRLKTGLHYMFEVYLATAEEHWLLAAERSAAAAGPEFLDYFRRNAPVWEAEWRSKQVGTAKRGPSTDPFTISYMRRLGEQDITAPRDSLRDFLEGAEPFITDARTDDQEGTEDPGDLSDVPF
jgi:hypothetical protein